MLLGAFAARLQNLILNLHPPVYPTIWYPVKSDAQSNQTKMLLGFPNGKS